MCWLELGFLGLFMATFLSATVIPFSSEAILAAMILGDFDPWMCVAIATIGNTLGGMSSYGLGYWGNWKKITRVLNADEQKVERWRATINKYGAYAALLCWTPFIGDVIALALGVFRVRMLPVLWWMMLGKLARFVVVAWFLLD